MNYRTEHDSIGPVEVPADALWGAQTQRSLNNFPAGLRDGRERMPDGIISALLTLKKACALANHELKPDKMTDEKLFAVLSACEKAESSDFSELFPLSVYQTGSGTQTNMNVNEVIANIAEKTFGYRILHPNDDVNMSQSTNDLFPSALLIAASLAMEDVKKSVSGLVSALRGLEEKYPDVAKPGRTHLQDAVPLRFSDEVSGWRGSLERDSLMIEKALGQLAFLPVGGTAVGNGVNCPDGFDVLVCRFASEYLGCEFSPSDNKFHGLTSLDGIVFAHGALKATACDLMKIANDVRWMSSGPNCGLGEITIPSNEPGSSIMPGKVNPTQCEALCMVAVRVMGNDASVGFAASQGNFELNAFFPVVASCFLQSAGLMSEAVASFTEKCVKGITPNAGRMRGYVEKDLMSATLLNPAIGYEKAAQAVKLAQNEGLSLREAVLKLGYMTPDSFDLLFL